MGNVLFALISIALFVKHDLLINTIRKEKKFSHGKSAENGQKLDKWTIFLRNEMFNVNVVDLTPEYRWWCNWRVIVP